MVHLDGTVVQLGVLLLHSSTSPRSVWSFICSPHVHVRFLRVLWFPPVSQKHAGRWISDFNLPLGVNECSHGTLKWTAVSSR